MKYKLLGALLCLGAVVLSLAAPILERQEAVPRYHQHRDAAVPAAAADEAAFSTHLPLVEIDTGGAEIPGLPAWREDGSFYYTTADGSDTIPAHMEIVDQEAAYHHPGDAPSVSSDITIHVRGNSSRTFDKRSYAIRLVTEDGVRVLNACPKGLEVLA